jgi:hypothetical protein
MKYIFYFATIMLVLHSCDSKGNRSINLCTYDQLSGKYEFYSDTDFLSEDFSGTLYLKKSRLKYLRPTSNYLHNSVGGNTKL